MTGEATIDVKLVRGPVQWMPLEPFPSGGGAECVFLGRTRAEAHAEHGTLSQLIYEAYEPMALEVLRTLAQQAAGRFGCLAVRVHHAVGEVEAGKASVLVQTACPHRAEAFEACRFIIDRLKAEAPIWKREVWADGTTWSRGTPVAVEGRG